VSKFPLEERELRLKPRHWPEYPLSSTPEPVTQKKKMFGERGTSFSMMVMVVEGGGCSLCSAAVGHALLNLNLKPGSCAGCVCVCARALVVVVCARWLGGGG